MIHAVKRAPAAPGVAPHGAHPTVPPVNLQQIRLAHADGVFEQSPIPTPGRTIVTQQPMPVDGSLPTPGRSGSSGAIPSFQRGRRAAPTGVLPEQHLAGQHVPMAAQNRLPSPEAGSLRLMAADPAMMLNQATMTVAASTPVLGRGSLGRAQTQPPYPQPQPYSARGMRAGGAAQPETNRLCEFLLNQLHIRVQQSHQEREQELRKQMMELKDMEDLFARAKEEVHSVLHRADEESAAAAANGVALPLRAPPSPKPPFAWQPSQEYEREFEVTGESHEIVTKVGDFEDQGWVIPVGGSWRLMRGGIYRWTIRIERKCSGRPQLQLGIHGSNHNQPWRLVTTSRCSWSRDDEPWQDRPAGDRLIDEGSFVHIEVDMRGINCTTGSFAMAIDDGPFEEFFDDIPLSQPYSLIPVVSMGGNQSCVRLCPNY